MRTQSYQPHKAKLPPSFATRKPKSRTTSVTPILPPKPQPPDTPHTTELHGEPPREDPLRWLHAGHRDPRVLLYLKQENDYAKAQLQKLQPLRKRLEDEVAELSWRQALALAAQQPEVATPVSSPRYGDFLYNREPAAGSASRYRHLRLRLDHAGAVSSASASAPPPSPRTALDPSSSPDHPQHAQHDQHAAQHVFLDEAQRAAATAAADPSAHAIHTVSPSPSFDLFAFTEASEPVPLGQRRPDRFVLHVHDASTGAQLLPPLPGVSGGLGWVVIPERQQRSAANGRNAAGAAEGGSLGSGGSGGGGGRLYFTRRAQRELWCLDMPPLAPPQPPAPSPTNSSLSGNPAATRPSARLVCRDPDGQPVRLVQYGEHLYSETLGNDGWAMEVRLLGRACCTPSATMMAAEVAERGHDEGGSGGAGARWSAGPPGSQVSGTDFLPGLTAVSQAPLGGCGASSGRDAAGVPLLHRAPGRRCRVVPFGLGRRQRREQDEGAGAGPQGPPLLLLLWVQDLDRPNGCVLVVPVGEHSAGGASVLGSELQVPEPLELLPHDPTLRIIHVAAVQPDRVLCMRAAVDTRGDPTGRYDVRELRVDWDAVQLRWNRRDEPDGENPKPDYPAGPALIACGSGSMGRPGRLAAGGGGSRARPLPQVVSVVRQRALRVLDGRPHALQVLGWDDVSGVVDVSYSSLAAPPAAARVRLLLERKPGGDGGDGASEETSASEAAVATAAGGGASSAVRTEAAATPKAAAAAGAALLELGGEGEPWVVMERLWATADDGAQVPITVCRPAGTDGKEHGGGSDGSIRTDPPLQPAPLLLRVYGAYGTDPPLDYQAWIPPLLRRGVAVAVAHVRGGGRLGPAWYEGGRGARKGNSSADLLAAARHLVEAGVTAPELLCLDAESAGGWAAGPALNAAGASLFRAAVLTVPTLDPLTSLLEDETYGPYELGDPRVDLGIYGSVRRWAPYDGLRRPSGNGARGEVFPPRLLLRVGLYDTNVPYWDPAKYMARLRSVTGAVAGPGSSGSVHCMQVKPGGHDAYDNLGDDAMRCAFVLWALGVHAT